MTSNIIKIYTNFDLTDNLTFPISNHLDSEKRKMWADKEKVLEIPTLVLKWCLFSPPSEGKVKIIDLTFGFTRHYHTDPCMCLWFLLNLRHIAYWEKKFTLRDGTFVTFLKLPIPPRLPPQTLLGIHPVFSEDFIGPHIPDEKSYGFLVFHKRSKMWLILQRK